MFDNFEHVKTCVRDSFFGGKIIVIGDLMLDIHIWGSVNRISPEAPVPVVKRVRQSIVAGGSGNVAMNLAGLGIRPKLIGIVGEDESAKLLQCELSNACIDISGVLTDPKRPTTTKMRIIGGHQQMLRLDQESSEDLSKDLEKEIILSIENEKEIISAIILSDYAKGVLTSSVCQGVIQFASKNKIPVLVDPKGTDWSKYRGATCVTPNRSELTTIVGNTLNSHDDVINAARELCTSYSVGSLAVTLSEDGIIYVSDTVAIHVPAMAKLVFDVSGAGDTAISTLSAAMASGVGIRDSLILANLAAGIVVGKVGTVPLEFGELFDALHIDSNTVHGPKIQNLNDAIIQVEAWKIEGNSIAFTNGCFDVLHAGHVSYLTKAKELGDKLIVGLNSDDSIRRIKGPSRPINSEIHRSLVLAGLESVDLVVLFSDDTPIELIKVLRPNFLVKGADYQGKSVVGSEEIKIWGGQLCLIDFVEGLSTTNILSKMATSS